MWKLLAAVKSLNVIVKRHILLGQRVFSNSCAMFDPNGSKVPSSKTTIEEFPLLGNKLPSVFHNPEQLCLVVLVYPSHQQSNTTQSPRVIERQRDIWVTSLVP